MKKLDNIVPSLELCRLIPKNSPFYNSVLVWHTVNKDRLNEYSYITFRKDNDDIPAPSLSEILEELPKSSTGKYPSAAWYDVESEWEVRCFVPGNLVSARHDNPAEAALKLWLLLKERILK